MMTSSLGPRVGSSSDRTRDRDRYWTDSRGSAGSVEPLQTSPDAVFVGYVGDWVHSAGFRRTPTVPPARLVTRHVAEGHTVDVNALQAAFTGGTSIDSAIHTAQQTANRDITQHLQQVGH